MNQNDVYASTNSANSENTLVSNENSMNQFLSLDRFFDEIFDRNIDRFYKNFYYPFSTDKMNQINQNKSIGNSFNFHEDDTSYTYEIELAGIPKDNLKVELHHGIINVSGEKKVKKEDSKNGYKYVGSSYGSFSRSFRIPDNGDKDSIKAIYNDGVLTLSMNKKQNTHSEARKVDIQ